MPIHILTPDTPVTRLDKYVAEQHPELSRAQVRRLIDQGHLLVNGAEARASQGLRVGDTVRVDIPEEQTGSPVPEALPLTVVYEDDDLLVVNKPPGLVVHPAPGHTSGTLVNALLAYRPVVAAADLDPLRPGIVHRLDRDTSGLLVVALTRDVQTALQAQFKARRVTKRYLALLRGTVEREKAAIEAPLGRDPDHRQRMAVVSHGGRPARTEFTVRERLGDATFVEALLITGRTHQIRVHCASIGHPVVGDRIYGPRRSRLKAPRQMLHAWQLTFAHPATTQELTFTAPLPADFEQLLARLRRAV